MAALPLVVWMAKEWFLIGLATTIPGAFLLLYWKFAPFVESPRWLFSVGKLEKSSQILLQIAKCNGREKNLSKIELDKVLQRLYNSQTKSEGRTGVWTLFSRKRLAKNTMLLTLCWFVKKAKMI
jgi:hypothetical protein